MGKWSSFARCIPATFVPHLTEPGNAPDLEEGELLLFFRLLSFFLLVILHILSPSIVWAVSLIAEPGGICCSDKGREFSVTWNRKRCGYEGRRNSLRFGTSL